MGSNQQPATNDQQQEKVWPLPADGIRLALVLDGQGGGAPIDWDGLERWSLGTGTLWLQVDPRHEHAMACLRESALLTADELQVLLSSPARATLRPVDSQCLVLSVRGVGPEGEVVAGPTGIVRNWFGPRLVLALLEYDVAGTDEVHRLYREGRGPRDGPELLAWYAKLLSDRFYAAAAELEARMAQVEAQQPLHSEALKQVQSEVLQVHRQLAPHKVMTSRAVTLTDSPFIRPHLQAWRDVWDQNVDTDNLLRALQHRNLAVHHYASAQLARRINAAALVLAFVSTIALPLTLVGAVLSMKVGIPSSGYPWLNSTLGASSVPVAMVLLVGLSVLIVRRHMSLWRQGFNGGGRTPQRHDGADTDAPQGIAAARGRGVGVAERHRRAKHLPCGP